MKINNQLFLNLYMVVAIVHIYTLISDNEQYIVLSKYLLMPMLLLHVIVNCRKTLKNVIPLIAALFFCWVGDILLIYVDVYEQFFMFGLAAFLIGHIFYIWSFRKYATKNPGSVSYTHLRAHETVLDLVCRLLLEKKKKIKTIFFHLIVSVAADITNVTDV